MSKWRHVFIILLLLTILSAACLQGSGVRDLVFRTKVAFGVEEVSYEELGEDISGWFAAAEDRGISLVGIDAIELDGYIIFDSPTLRGAGFREDPEYGLILPEVLREAKKRNIKIIVMLEGIAHIISDFYSYSDSIDKKKLTPDAVASSDKRTQ
jgi:hypothetical protein